MTSKIESHAAEGTISHELPCIDMVRGGSSILVATSHVGIAVWPALNQAWFSVGALAVNLFMIVSGFLMTISLCKNGEPKTINRRNLLSFYIRRFFRISPAFYCAYALSFALAPTSWISAFLHVTYLFGLFPSYSADGMVVPFWSISLEVQFYLVVPFLLALFRYVNATIVLAACMAVALIANRLFGIYGAEGPLGGYPLPSFLPLSLGYFVMGILLALHFMKSRHAPQVWISAMLMLATVLPHPFLKNAYLAVGSSMLVLFWLGLSSQAGRWLEPARRLVAVTIRGTGISRRLADYSYSLYLFHTFLIVLLLQRTDILSGLASLPKPAAFLIASVIIVGLGCLVALAVFRFIEKPGVHLGKRLERKLI